MKFLAVLVVIAIALFQVSLAYPRAEPAPLAIPEAFAVGNPEPVALANAVGYPEAYAVAVADPDADPEANPAPILALIRCPLPIIICAKATIGRK